MKNAILSISLFLVHLSSYSQFARPQHEMDSLHQLLTTTMPDTMRYEVYFHLGMAYSYVNPEQAVQNFNNAILLAQQLGDSYRVMGASVTLSLLYSQIGQSSKSLEILMKVLRWAEDKNEDTSMALAFIGMNLEAQGDYINALNYYRQSFYVYEDLRLKKTKIIVENGYVAGPLMFGNIFEKLNKLDSALYYAQMSQQRISEKDISTVNIGFYCQIYNLLGKIHQRMGHQKEAFLNFMIAYYKAREADYVTSIQESQVGLANYYFEANKPDSTIYYALPAYTEAKKIKGFKVMQEAASLLRLAYEKKGLLDKALYYNDLAIAARDSVTGAEKVREVQILTNKEEIFQLKLQQEAEASRIALENKVKMYALLAILGSLVLLATFLYINNQQKHKVNTLLHEQKDEIANQKNKAEKALTDLKSTQAQLIQSEKMASLGELTAGIAHEIQNPLNFVNNFSELSVDLAKELKEEVEKLEIPDKDKEYVAEIIGDLSQNQEKINLHGKRASDIVKGMLEHSRKSSGTKEPTDINALADEYLRLAFHGLKAKDKDFNAIMETHFDPNLPKIDVIPQDIGRVLLNLITNAFYACTERSRSAVNEKNKQLEWADSPSGVGGKGGNEQEPKYEPTVTITTQLTANSQLLIAIKDNGSGIPDAIKDKIFQPFFTTKPTGQGTGLGLSLAYDIVKAHGGELKVESTLIEGSEFRIALPI